MFTRGSFTRHDLQRLKAARQTAIHTRLPSDNPITLTTAYSYRKVFSYIATPDPAGEITAIQRSYDESLF